MRRTDAGVTLLEVLIAVTLLSMLSLGMLFAMRLGLNAFSKTNTKLMDNRRVAGAQRVLEQELQGLIPVLTPCGGARASYFQGRLESLTMVSSFSLQQGWRGQPQVLQFLVIPGETEGMRLVVNETLYVPGSKQLCGGGGEGGMPDFIPAHADSKSFVLADKLKYCRFSYLGLAQNPKDPGVWDPLWTKKGWPLGIRVEMAPLDPNPSRLQPVTVTAPIYLMRSPEMQYADN